MVFKRLELGVFDIVNILKRKPNLVREEELFNVITFYIGGDNCHAHKIVFCFLVSYD